MEKSNDEIIGNAYPTLIKVEKSNDEIIGNAYLTLKELVKEYAIKDMPVLFCGDSGTGKELLAKLFMASSKRLGKKMTVNCAASSDELLRSEIFGHVIGAFTGATRERKGKIKTCDKGILFLDELGDASQELQAAILRVVEGYSFSSLGSDVEEKYIDTKIIAATLKPDQIRQDLRERFHLLPVPPLQKTDIPIIAKHFLGNRSVKAEILTDLLSREYPGNVRSLKKYCESLMLERGESIFSKYDAEYPLQDIDFDYERYRREIKTWQKYIQPLINKLEITTFSYEYMAWDSEIMKEPLWEHYLDGIATAVLLTHGYKRSDLWPISESAKENFVKLYGQNMIELIDKLQNESDVELKGKFVFHLEKYFKDGTLPYLLETLQETGTGIKDEPMIMIPPTSSLLNCPLDEAETEFRKRYAEYNIKRYKSNVAELEKATGRKKKHLQQIIRRANSSKKE